MDEPKRSERPAIISIICALGFIGAATSPLTLLRSPLLKTAPAWYTYYIVPHWMLVLIALIGVWKMKRWGVVLYTLTAIEAQAALMLIGYWSVFAAVIYALLLAPLLYYLPQMD